MDITYSLPDGLGSLILTGDVLAQFAKHQQKGLLSKEAGGQLFCSFEDKILRVVLATGPTKKDLRSRFGFSPNRKEEQKEINHLFNGDGLHYIGDWHTHPEDTPSPSGSDVESIETILTKGTHELPGVVLIVVGRNGFPSGLYISFHSVSGMHVLDPVAI